MQSLQDSAFFAENVTLPGLKDYDLHVSPQASRTATRSTDRLSLQPNKTAWLYTGGSYAGAKAAFARKLFPDIWWGAIASSAVTTAIEDFWEYYEVS